MSGVGHCSTVGMGFPMVALSVFCKHDQNPFPPFTCVVVCHAVPLYNSILQTTINGNVDMREAHLTL